MIALAAVGFVAGAGAGIVVTRRLHRHLYGWGERLGRTRYRWANLPVGGGLAYALAAPAPASLEPLLLGAAVGGAASAIGWRFVDPLPPCPRPRRRA